MKKKKNNSKNNERKQMFRKIILVIFITLLIWVWADLSQDEAYRDSSAIVYISQTADPSLWVRFARNSEPELRLKQIKIEGPAIRIAELKRDIAEGLVQLRFELDPVDVGLESSDNTYKIPLIQILNDNKELRKRGLKVTETSTESVQILATRLEEKQLRVTAIEENNTQIENAEIDPRLIRMLVPPSWQGQMLVATVKLTTNQIIRARKEPISVKPTIELTPGVTRTSDTPVEIKLPTDGVNLIDKPVQGSLGFVVSQEIMENYNIVLDNPSDFFTSIQIKATEEAFEVYNNQKYKLLLEIQADDVKKEIVLRAPQYNFPQEFLRTGEITAVKQPERARFRLIPKNTNQQ